MKDEILGGQGKLVGVEPSIVAIVGEDRTAVTIRALESVSVARTCPMILICVPGASHIRERYLCAS